ncbi:DUF262 domain-containing protein [Brachyspira aalborgi]|uniref:DUF262 domain-containing protein n=1 Tax=Brachyspira aalborgi TaxID=29522 RepID=A0A5C8GH37_9SPIR|nr:DUF262 domain-containing protein [Brachyspira aalborgi]TXJ61227.1 DUF262 domain-containing protein [Brachyspira aalborgi]
MEFKPEKQYIAKLLGEEGQKFIIPEYQRPYRWTKNECETLWDDVKGVFGNGENIEEYFLGSIVTYKNDNGELEIIDGQQRITTFTLLFRAFYEHLKSEFKTARGDYPIDFGKCIWKYIRNEGFDFENRHLSSQIITSNDEKALEQILSENCKLENKYKNSNYFKNYDYFYQKLMDFKGKQGFSFQKFCDMFLGNKLFVLLVVCDSQESAMTIFNTLNSRGLPLSNADILKGYIYKKVKNKEKFANDWKDIETKIEESENVKDLDFLFLQYMHIIRAENEDTNTTTQGILPFFTKTDKKEYYGALQDWLYKPETMPFISNLADFWISPKEYLSEKSSRYISILNLFQNDTWKFFVSYLVWRNKNCFNNDTFNKNKFSKEFDKFLPELIKYITLPFLNNNATTGVVKEIVFKMNVSLYKKENFTIGNSMPKQKVFFEIINSFDTRKIKYILFLYAYIYSKFKEDINASDLEVEHILPKEWQNMDVSDFDEESHKKYVEKIGNKILLDKKSNIKCSNNFFAKKQEIYKKIYDKGYNLKEVYDLGIRERNIWEKTDIDNREKEIYKNLNSFLSSNN